MRNLCTVTVVGNVGRDPETRALASGQEVVSFSVAVTTRRGERESTAWYRVSCFGGLASVARDWVRKGNPVMVQGALEARLLEGRDKQPILSLDVNARDLILLGGAPAREGAEEDPGRTAASAARAAVVKRTEAGRIVPADEPDIEEMPF